MTDRCHSGRWLLALPLAILGGCDDPEPQQSQGEARAERMQRRHGFEVWHADFPYPVQKWKPPENPWYRFSSRRALERIVGKLQGHYSKISWKASKEFFSRAGEEAIPVLIEALDRNMQSHHLADVVQNTVEAMGRMGRHHDPELAAAILRALQHRKASVQNSAMAALVTAGTPETVRQARAYLDALEPRASLDWVRAARAHLPPDEVDQIFHQLIDENRSGQLFMTVVEETVKLPVERSVRVLEPFWNEARGALRLTIASVLNATGDRRGTRYLRDQLHSDVADRRVTALGALAASGVDLLLDDVLRLALDADPAVRQAVIGALVGVPGENVDNVLIALAADPEPSVRMNAHSALRSRDRRGPVDPLIKTVRSASGTALIHAMTDLSASGQADGIAAICERMQEAPAVERRKYIQALGRSRTAEGFAALREVFLQDEYAIDDSGRQTNVMYTSVLFPNLQDSRYEMLRLYRELPTEDHRRRACMLHALGNVAALAADEEFNRAVYDSYREVIRNRDEIPQLRLMALQFLERDLRIEDMLMLREMQESEEGPMRRMLVAYLYEFF